MDCQYQEIWGHLDRMADLMPISAAIDRYLSIKMVIVLGPGIRYFERTVGIWHPGCGTDGAIPIELPKLMIFPMLVWDELVSKSRQIRHQLV